MAAILTVPVIIAIALGSVLLISKVGGKTASRQIQRMKGIPEDREKH